MRRYTKASKPNCMWLNARERSWQRIEKLALQAVEATKTNAIRTQIQWSDRLPRPPTLRSTVRHQRYMSAHPSPAIRSIRRIVATPYLNVERECCVLEFDEA